MDEKRELRSRWQRVAKLILAKEDLLTVIDRVPEWIENISWITDEIDDIYSKRFGRRRDWPASFHVLPFALDFSDLDGFGNLPSLFRRDIFVLNYVLSEVFDLDELLPIMKNMVKGCPAAAHFLFIDRSDNQTSGKMATLVEELGLEEECRGETKGNMDTDEQKSELQDISEFLRKQPRVTWNAEWILAVKPERK